MLTLFLFLALPPVSFAADDWSICAASSECVVDEEQCYRPLAINKKFLKQNQESNERSRPLIQCLEYKGPPKEKYRAVCKGKKCTLELK